MDVMNSFNQRSLLEFNDLKIDIVFLNGFRVGGKDKRGKIRCTE